MKNLTIDSLKENRSLIIQTITNSFGEDKVKEIMTFMVNGISETCSETVEAYLNEVSEIFEFKMHSKNDTGNRYILGKLEQLEIENN